MNVLRTVGKGWGIAVGFLDAGKAFVPMLLTRMYLFPGPEPLDYLITVCVGIAAIMGHRKPVFHRFKGGGSVACAMGCYIFVAVWEILAAFVVSAVVTVFFMKHVKYRYGRWAPIIAIVIAPFLVLIANATVYVPMFAGTSIGGHPWEVTAGSFMISLTMLFLNVGFLIYQAREKGRGEGTHAE